MFTEWNLEENENLKLYSYVSITHLQLHFNTNKNGLKQYIILLLEMWM